MEIQSTVSFTNRAQALKCLSAFNFRNPQPEEGKINPRLSQESCGYRLTITIPEPSAVYPAPWCETEKRDKQALLDRWAREYGATDLA
jgi:hypothetical protein